MRQFCVEYSGISLDKKENCARMLIYIRKGYEGDRIVENLILFYPDQIVIFFQREEVTG